MAFERQHLVRMTMVMIMTLLTYSGVENTAMHEKLHTKLSLILARKKKINI